MIDIKIRTGKEKDVKRIYELGDETKELRFSRKMHFHEKREIREWIGDKKRNILLVAEIDKKVIGFAYAIIVDKDWCMIDNIAVDGNFREQGIGYELLRELMKELKKRKVTYTCALVEKDYTKTKHFWEKNGFRQGETFVWYGENVK